MMFHVLLLTVGFVFLVKGADWFVEGAAGIAKKLGIPQLVIGLTIVAMGTSMPEAAVSITSAIGGSAGISIGNVKTTFRYEIPYMIGITIVLMIFGMTGNKINFMEGILLWLLFLIFLGYLFVISKNGSVQDEEEIKEVPLWKGILFIIIGGILVVKGSDFAVDGATEIARYFGMSERFIGLTIVAFGTSLPELVTSVTAARRGNADIAIGNIVGSNIFNILFVIGTTALICDVPFDQKFVTDTLVAIFSGVLLWVGTIRYKELRKKCGIVMLVCYAAYFIYLCR